MKVYTDEEVSALIKCAKVIIDPPLKQAREERGSRRNGMIIQSKDKQYRFRVYIRQSVEFEEDFSVGLEYLPKDEAGSFTLLRCNGKHGGHEAFPHHLNYHIHTVKAEDINAGIKTERHIEPTLEYASFLEAISYFLSFINLEGCEKYFPEVRRVQKQGLLFTDESEGRGK